jgi:hypothetical protein
VSACALVWVNLERKSEEVSEYRRQCVLLLDCWCSVCRNEPQRAERALVEVRGLSFNHFNGHDTKRPDVDLAAILLSGYDLWCHPVGGADHGRSLVVVLVDLRAESEISCIMLEGWVIDKDSLTEFDVAFKREKNVIRLDISVDDAL